MIDVAIVGGGVAGLATALNVLENKPDAKVLVLERRHELGGNVRTLERDGCVIDLGPDTLVNRPGDACVLAGKLGVALSAPEASGASVMRHGDVMALPEGLAFGVPRDLGAIARTKLLSPQGKLRAACDLVIPRVDVDGLGVGAIIQKRLGREVRDALVEPLLSGVYGGDVDRLDPALVMPNLVSGTSVLRGLARAATVASPKASPVVGPHEGMRSLVDAMVRHIGRERIRCDARVRTLERIEQSQGGGFRLTLDDTQLDARRVVLASPPTESAALIHGLDPELAELLASFSMRSSASVILAYPRDACAFPKGTGVLVAHGESPCFVAVTFVHEKWPDRVPEHLAIVRAVVTHESAPTLLDAVDTALVARVHHDLHAIGKVPAAPLWSYVERFDRATAIPELGHRARVSQARTRAHALGLALAGAAYDGPGIAGSIAGAQAIASTLL